MRQNTLNDRQPRVTSLSAESFTEQITFRETKRIVGIIDRVSKNRGWQRTDLIREAVRTWLANGSHLTDQEKKDLGISSEKPQIKQG